MYNTYKLRSFGPNLNKKLICKYVTFIVLLTIICTSLVTTCDVMSGRTAFDTVNGHCAIDVNVIDIRNISSWLIPMLLLLIAVTQLIIFGLGIILYFVVSRDLCTLKTTDVKVCITLVSTSGLQAILFVVSFLLIKNHSTSIPVLFTTVGVLVEQLVLLMMLIKKAVVSSSAEKKQSKN